MKMKDWGLTVSSPYINYFKHIISDIVQALTTTTENESKKSQNKTKKDKVLSKEQGDYIHAQDAFK